VTASGLREGWRKGVSLCGRGGIGAKRKKAPLVAKERETNCSRPQKTIRYKAASPLSLKDEQRLALSIADSVENVKPFLCASRTAPIEQQSGLKSGGECLLFREGLLFFFGRR